MSKSAGHPASADLSVGKTRPAVPLRAWATPLTIGAFFLMAVTGILMFFGWRRGLTSEVHEWFSWLFLAGAFGHIVANIRPFVSHLKSRWGKVSAAASIVVLVACLLPLGITTGHQLRGAVEQAVLDAPLSTLASLANVAPGELENRLKTHGIVAPLEQSVQQASDGDRHGAQRLLAIVFLNE
jgi:hypothetical protein